MTTPRKQTEPRRASPPVVTYSRVPNRKTRAGRGFEIDAAPATPLLTDDGIPEVAIPEVTLDPADAIGVAPGLDERFDAAEERDVAAFVARRRPRWVLPVALVAVIALAGGIGMLAGSFGGARLANVGAPPSPAAAEPAPDVSALGPIDMTPAVRVVGPVTAETPAARTAPALGEASPPASASAPEIASVPSVALAPAVEPEPLVPPLPRPRPEVATVAPAADPIPLAPAPTETEADFVRNIERILADSPPTMAPAAGSLDPLLLPPGITTWSLAPDPAMPDIPPEPGAPVPPEPIPNASGAEGE